MCYSPTTLPTVAVARGIDPGAPLDAANASTTSPTSSATNSGVPCLGPLEGLTWATTGLARNRGDRLERGSGVGTPTPPLG